MRHCSRLTGGSGPGPYRRAIQDGEAEEEEKEREDEKEKEEEEEQQKEKSKNHSRRSRKHLNKSGRTKSLNRRYWKKRTRGTAIP